MKIPSPEESYTPTEMPVDDSADETLAADETLGRTPSEPTPALVAGALIGRYVVLSRLGVGGMGVVVAAYDPQLDRKIALKLLKPRGRDRERAQARLQREAQALAQLNHPNVVTVHDVGVHDGQVFVAMEFVEGQTLGEWMESAPDGKPRPWAEVVELVGAAGRGLAAAHERGLIHRDFKPDNVMLGADGRVRVMDFGLARTPGPHSISHEHGDPSSTFEPSGERLASTGRSSERRLTRTGALLGTPAYMAPEQYQAQGVTAHSDQFSFCVVLYEALYGMRPFAGDNTAELACAVLEGQVREPRTGARVPVWLRKLVRRGLSVNPTARFPDMQVLLAALGTSEARRRRTRWLVAGATVVAAAAAVLGGQRWERTQRIEHCAAQGDSIDQVWNVEARQVLRQSLESSGAREADYIADKVEPWIDDYAESWRVHQAAACTNIDVDRTWEQSMADRAQWCLDDRRLQLVTLLERFSSKDARDVQQAVKSAASLMPVQPCLDEGSLLGTAAPPPAELELEVAKVRRELSATRHLDSSGKYELALELIERLIPEAEALSWSPLLASSLLIEASVRTNMGQFAEAEATSQRAYMLAARSNSWDVAAEAATQLVFVLGRKEARYDEAHMWAEHARTAIEHAGDPTGLREADVSFNLGSVHQAKGEYTDAKDAFERALVLREDVLGSEHPAVARSLNNLGAIHERLGMYTEANALYRRALAIREALFGPRHPVVARSLANIGNTHYAMGQLEEAKALYERALGVIEGALGPEHPDVAVLLSNLGSLHQTLGEYERAWDTQERALEIRRATLGPDHPHVAISVFNLGNVRSSQGRDAEARELYEQSIEIRERTLGPEHPDLAFSLVGLGQLLVSMGEFSAGLEHLERALTLSEPTIRGSSLMALANALWVAPPGERDRPRARRLAEQAREAYVDVQREPEDIAEVDRWLESHPL